jgi:hypothetical protein
MGDKEAGAAAIGVRITNCAAADQLGPFYKIDASSHVVELKAWQLIPIIKDAESAPYSSKQA